jgi:UDP-N-acetylglucosamine 1-carboxyvinyltransferase
MNTGDSFVVTGGNKLHGTLTPQGAKNEALQILCATLLTEELVIIENLPDILDIRHLIELIRGLGVIVTRLGPNSYSFCAKDVDLDYFGTHEFQSNARKIRGSVMLLARFLQDTKERFCQNPEEIKLADEGWTLIFLAYKSLVRYLTMMSNPINTTSVLKN